MFERLPIAVMAAIALATSAVSGECLAKAVWERIVSAIPAGTLQLIKLVQTRDLFYEYAG